MEFSCFQSALCAFALKFGRSRTLWYKKVHTCTPKIHVIQTNTRLGTSQLPFKIQSVLLGTTSAMQSLA